MHQLTKLRVGFANLMPHLIVVSLISNQLITCNFHHVLNGISINYALTSQGFAVLRKLLVGAVIVFWIDR